MQTHMSQHSASDRTRATPHWPAPTDCSRPQSAATSDGFDSQGRRVMLSPQVRFNSPFCGQGDPAAMARLAPVLRQISPQLERHLQARSSGGLGQLEQLGRLDAATMLRLSAMGAFEGVEDDAFHLWEKEPFESLTLLCVDHPLGDEPGLARDLDLRVATKALTRWPTVKPQQVRCWVEGEPARTAAVTARLDGAPAGRSGLDLDDPVFYGSPKLSRCCGLMLGPNDLAGAMAIFDKILLADDVVAAGLSVALFNLQLSRGDKYTLGPSASSTDPTSGDVYSRKGSLVALAAFRGAQEITHMLLAAGADPNARLLETMSPAEQPLGWYENVSKIPIYHLARCHRDQQMAELILKRGGRRDQPSKNDVHSRTVTWNGKNGDNYFGITRSTDQLDEILRHPAAQGAEPQQLWRLRNASPTEIKRFRAGEKVDIGTMVLGAGVGAGAELAAGVIGGLLGA